MNDEDIERVLKAAGMRERAPADVEHEVREHLRQEWREIVAERRGARRRWSGLAIAASILVAALGLMAGRLAARGARRSRRDHGRRAGRRASQERLVAWLATGRRRPNVGRRRFSGNGPQWARSDCHAWHRIGTTRSRYTHTPRSCRTARHRTRRTCMWTPASSCRAIPDSRSRRRQVWCATSARNTKSGSTDPTYIFGFARAESNGAPTPAPSSAVRRASS